MSLINKFILLFFKYGINRSINFLFNIFFWLNLLIKNKKIYIKYSNIDLIKIKVKINKKSFNTYFRRKTIKFINFFSILLINYKNILLSFIFLYKPKKSKINKLSNNFSTSEKNYIKNLNLIKIYKNVYNF